MEEKMPLERIPLKLLNYQTVGRRNMRHPLKDEQRAYQVS